jgi:hypothetical protein
MVKASVSAARHQHNGGAAHLGKQYNQRNAINISVNNEMRIAKCGGSSSINVVSETISSSLKASAYRVKPHNNRHHHVASAAYSEGMAQIRRRGRRGGDA